MCSAAARGVWIDLLCHAFKCEERGVFRSNGKQWGSKEVAALCGITEPEAEAALKELVSTGTAETMPDGTVYNRRMVADEKQRRCKVEAGRKGGKRSKRKSKPEAKGGSPTPTPTPTPLQVASRDASAELLKNEFGIDGFKAAGRIAKTTGGNFDLVLEVAKRLAEWNKREKIRDVWKAAAKVAKDVTDEESDGVLMVKKPDLDLRILPWPNDSLRSITQERLLSAGRNYPDLVLVVQTVRESLQNEKYATTREEVRRRLIEIRERCYPTSSINI